MAQIVDQRHTVCLELDLLIIVINFLDDFSNLQHSKLHVMHVHTCRQTNTQYAYLSAFLIKLNYSVIIDMSYTVGYFHLHCSANLHVTYVIFEIDIEK